jgi:hypothetical protein
LKRILRSKFRNFAEFIEKKFLIKQTDASFQSLKDILLSDINSKAEITLNSELVLKYIQGEFPFSEKIKKGTRTVSREQTVYTGLRDKLKKNKFTVKDTVVIHDENDQIKALWTYLSDQEKYKGLDEARSHQQQQQSAATPQVGFWDFAKTAFSRTASSPSRNVATFPRTFPPLPASSPVPAPAVTGPAPAASSPVPAPAVTGPAPAVTGPAPAASTPVPAPAVTGLQVFLIGCQRISVV